MPHILFVFLVICFTVLPVYSANEQKTVKAGFLFVGPINDYGWNCAQNEGRLFVEKKLAGKIQTVAVENVPESAEAERVMERMIAQGAKIIFATSFGYLEPVLKVARRHPDVKFMQLSRFDKRPNLRTYFYLHYQGSYLAGVVAGRMSKKNKIGFVAAHPVPPLLQSINAFALGVRSVNAKATVKVVWTNKWVDPAVEAEAAKGLIDNGIDVLAFDQSAPVTIVKTAESNKTYVIGCYTDDCQFAPNYWLTGVSFDWGPYYARICQSVLDGTWQEGTDVCDIKTGNVKLSSFGKAVPEPLRKEVAAAKEKIANGSLVVFAGPLKDREGRERLSAGAKPNIKWLAGMNFFVPGVEGTLPKN
ncbi:MAG: BMP family ABC transporter substrate-binding protein [Candidatus Obscuribacterales bacterium]|nr:BMP family ABC transporter substrate-binding protein [Candidatus Obscuribacterales bacterium]